MEWTQEQLCELKHAAHTHPKAGLRVKALAVLAVARGSTYRAVGEMFDTSSHSISAWARSYRERGLEAFEVAAGRGRPKKANDDEVETYALQSPRNFGINRSRWRLADLARTVPSLAGFSVSGVRQALRRRHISYKRGQPWMSSPDPEYEKKDR
jgi:transposase